MQLLCEIIAASQVNPIKNQVLLDGFGERKPKTADIFADGLPILIHSKAPDEAADRKQAYPKINRALIA